MPRFCLSCDTGAIMARFEDQTETIEHFGMSRTVASLSGWRCRYRSTGPRNSQSRWRNSAHLTWSPGERLPTSRSSQRSARFHSRL